MWNWLINNPDAVAAIGAVLGGFIFKTKKEASLDQMKDKLLAKLRRELLGLLEEHASVEKARNALTFAADALLDEVKLKRNAVVDVIVEALIEQALKEYAEKLATVTLRLRIDELFGAVSKLPAAFEAPAKPLGLNEPLLSGMTVEVVKR